MVLLGLLPLMCSNHQWIAPSIDNEASAAHLLEEDDCHCQRGLLGTAAIVEDELELVATIIDKRARGAAMDAYK